MIENSQQILTEYLQTLEKEELELQKRLEDLLLKKQFILQKIRSLKDLESVEEKSSSPSSSSFFTIKEKIAMFRSLFRGREDVYPERRERPNRRPSYEPVGTSGWSCRICRAAKANPKLCPHRIFSPLSDAVIYHHLAGTKNKDEFPTTIGIMIAKKPCRSMTM